MPRVPRVTVRKKHGLCLGSRTVVCKVGPKKKGFILHENVLCSRSAFFRNAIQPKRREIESECSICHEELDFNDGDLTYCSASCGGNFHGHCMEKWQKQGTARAKCPLCRHEWKTPPTSVQSLLTVSECGFEIYVGWLYGAMITNIEDGKDIFEELVEAYSVGIHLGDQDFCKAILQSIIETCVDFHENPYPNESIVKLAYDMNDESRGLKDLLVGLYIRSEDGKGGSGLDSWENLPKEFLYDCATTMMSQVPADKKLWTFEALTVNLLPPSNHVDDEPEDE